MEGREESPFPPEPMRSIKGGGTRKDVGAPVAATKEIRGSSLLLVGRVLAMALNLGTQALIVRYLAKDDFGAFAYALAFAQTARIVVTLGHERTITRFLAIYEERHDYNRLVGTLVMETGIILGAGLILVLGALTFKESLAGSLLQTDHAITVLLIILVMVPIDALNRFVEKIFAVFARPRAIFFRRYLLSPVIQLAVVFTLIGTQRSAVFLAGGYVVASVVGLIFNIWPLAQLLKIKGLLGHSSFRRMVMPLREIFSFTLPLLSTELVVISMSTVSVALLGHFSGAAEVADFRAILPAAALNLFVYQQFTILFMPLAARLYARGDRQHMREAYWQTAVWLVLLTFPVFAMTFVFAEPVTITLFGERYSQSAIYLSLLSLGNYCNVSLGFNALVLQVYGRIKYLVCANVVATIVNVGLSVPLILRYGALGAAVANLVTLIAQNLLNQAGLRRGIGVGMFSSRYARVYVSTVACVSLLLFVESAISMSMLGGAVLTLLASAALLAFNRDVLTVSAVFPELARVPGLRRILS